MTEYSLQPNIRTSALSGVPGGLTMPPMPRRGPNKPSAPRKPRKALLRHLKGWLLFRDLTVDELADAAGLSNASVSAMENLKQGYSPESLDALAAALGIDTATLLSVSPSDVGSIWPLWTAASDQQKQQLTEIAKTLIRPGR